MKRARHYRAGKLYRDTGNLTDDDQFMRWINLPGSGMPNSGGIRRLKHVGDQPFSQLLGLIVLVTSHSTTNPHNPREDIIDTRSGKISYWGDAEAKPLWA